MNHNVFPFPEVLEKYTGQQSVIVRSPGRINLIGEHTDYNDGFVLPAAIDKAAFICITPRVDKEIRLHAIDLDDNYITSADDINPVKDKTWANYLLGVAEGFIKKGIDLNGFEAVVTSDIPIGAGLSSSAAVECAMAKALDAMLHTSFSKIDLIKISQKAEHEYAGVMCGIMDQFASMMSVKDHVIKLDCRSLEFEYLPFDTKGYSIVLFDSGVKHSLASSEYNTRRSQCEEAVVIVKKKYGEVQSLRDVTMVMLNECVLPASALLYKRCRYVVEEKDRLLAGCDDLAKGDIISFGKKMFTTHDGLSRMYEVSCPELDFLVAHTRNHPAVKGARMMGGGFGGCTINIIDETEADKVIADTAAAYLKAWGTELKTYVVKTSDGTSVYQ